MLLMHANKRDDIKEAHAGDIIALAGLKDTTTGDTLCDADKPIVLENMVFPDPVIQLAVEPKTKADVEKMGLALSRLAMEDPSFRVTSDPDSGQTIIAGMGELHLDIIVDRLRREFKVDANVGDPQVAYRETITKPCDIEYTHKNNLVVPVSLLRLKSNLNQLKIIQALNLLTPLSAVTFLRNISLVLKKVCAQLWIQVCWPVIL